MKQNGLQQRREVRDVEYIRTLPVGVKHLRDNCAVPQLDPAAIRIRRYILLSGCQRLVFPYWREAIDRETGEIRKKSEFRVSVCCRESVDDDVRIYRNESAVGYSGILRCGNVWACPICCAKVMRRRSEQIAALFDAVHKKGGSAVMITYTAAHAIGDKLVTLLDSFKSAKRTLTQSRIYRNLSESRTGAVSATEITYSNQSGWHPHQHDVWFFSGSAPDADQLADALFPAWRAATAKHGLSTLAAYRGHRVGVDVRAAWDASEYLAKFDRERDWSLASEMTAGRLKSAQGQSMTPWALLEDAIIRGKDSPAARLWIEYLRATKGKTVVSLMPARSLLQSFGMPTTLDDFVDANSAGEGEVITQIPADRFDFVVRSGGLGRLLEAARQGDLNQLGQLFNFNLEV